MTRLRLLFVLLTGLLSACTLLPNQGPTTSSFAIEDLRTPSETNDGFIVVDIDARTVKHLENRGYQSFGSLSGAHRGVGPYRIGVGDAVGVTIWEANGGGLFAGSPQVATGSSSVAIPAQVVERDGAITIPYAGRVTVAGLSLADAEAKIVESLQGKAIEPQAIVSVKNNVSNTVTVTGEVVAGKRIPLSQNGDRILDVIAAAGGARSPTYETLVTLSRAGQTLSVPLTKLINNPSENIYARPGDTITVVREVNTFTALGATGRNTLVDFGAEGITLEKAVAKAGGLINVLSDPGGVFLLRREPASLARKLDPDFPIANRNARVNVVYRANLRDPNALFLASRVDVLSDDILYVSGAPSTEISKFLSLVGLGTDSANELSSAIDRFTP